MTTRPVRDILAEVLRRERYGLIRPMWAETDDSFREPIRLRADHIIRLLKALGVELVATNPAQNIPQNIPDPIVCRDPIIGDPGAFRIVRADGGPRFSVLIEKDGVQTLETSFTPQGASLIAGKALADDPEIKTIKHAGKTLAAMCEAYRLAYGIGGGE